MDEPRKDIFASPAPPETSAPEVDADELADARRDDAWRAFAAEGERYAAEHTPSLARDQTGKPVSPA